MALKKLVPALLIVASVAGCPRSPSDHVHTQPKVVQVEAPPKNEPMPVEWSATGKWSLHRGRAVDTIDLIDTSGIIKGVITLDAAQGGRTFDLHGMRVGVEVEFFYSSETTHTEFHYKTKSAFSFKGALEQGRMSGK